MSNENTVSGCIVTEMLSNALDMGVSAPTYFKLIKVCVSTIIGKGESETKSVEVVILHINDGSSMP